MKMLDEVAFSAPQIVSANHFGSGGSRRDRFQTSWKFCVGFKFDFQMSETDFNAVPEVEIDTGVFKYVLIRLYRFA